MIPTKRMPTVMGQGHSFARVPEVGLERSVFDRSCGYKTTFDAGLLVPVFVEYVGPGETHSVQVTALARLTTPIKPFMDNMYMDWFFFFVPFRLIWTNFPKFMGEQLNPGDSISFTVPQVVSPTAGYVLGSVADYMGLPTVGVPAVTVGYSTSALPGRAYELIYNQWFRDENLINSIVTAIGDGPDGTATMNGVPRKRGKRHDYFTSCLPWAQKGGAVAFLGTAPLIVSGTGIPQFGHAADGSGFGPLEAVAATDPTAVQLNPTTVFAVGEDLRWGSGAGASGLQADLTANSLGSTINDLRVALQTQAFLERDARGGTRYNELMWSHFKVKSSDARLQRAEYLGGGSTPVTLAPVAQTEQVAAPSFKDGLGNLGGVGAALVSGQGFHKSFEEHGVVIGIVNVRADLTYSQGIERFWSYSTRYDFPWPEFAHLGEQAVLNKEIYATGAAADALVFGYQERYAERRYKPSKVTNLFRPTAAGTLELWHLSEKFAALPTLGQTFIEDQTETVLDTRVAVPTEPDFYLDAWFDYKAAMPLPVFGVPQLGGRL